MCKRPRTMPGSSATRLMGVTSYIRDVLRGGDAFCRPRARARRPPKGRRGRATPWTAAQAGLKIGRAVDRAFIQLVRRTPPPPGKAATDRAMAAMAALRSRGLVPVAAQVQVDMPLLGLKTAIDAVFKDPRGNLVIVELKATTVTSQEHTAAYDTVCRNRPVLRRGGRNTEHNAHMLQCAFGVLAHPNAARGLVVVSCTDGALVYDCQQYEMHVFEALRQRPGGGNAIAPPVVPAPAAIAWARVPKWPGAPAAAALARLKTGVTNVVLNGRVALLDNGGAAVVARTAAAAVSKRFRAACKAAYAEVDRHTKLYVMCPQRGRFVAYKFQP